MKRDEEALTIFYINQLGRYGDLVNPGLAIIDCQPGKTGQAGFGTVHYLIVLVADICCKSFVDRIHLHPPSRH